MAKRYVSFDVVKASVTMEQVLEHYGLLVKQTTRKGDELVLHCIFHENDTTPSLKINTAKNIFNCFGCHVGGDLLDFVALKEGIVAGEPYSNRREAALLLQEWFHLGSAKRPLPRRRGAASPSKTPVPEATPASTLNGNVEQELAREGEEGPPNPPLTFTFKHLDPIHPYLAVRGLTPETIATFGLGFHAGKGMMAGRICIPIHNEQGELVAYAGRWPGVPPAGTPKYLLPAQFQKTLVLFNLHRAKAHAAEGLIVVEGYFTVFDFWQRGRKNVVALMGSAMSAEQERLIIETVGRKGRVLLALDADAAGKTGSTDAAVRLVQHVFCRTVELAH